MGISYNLNFYKYKEVFFNMKGDYSKIWRLAQYTPRVLGSWEMIKDPRGHLEKCISEHREFNRTYDSLNEEAREVLKPLVDDINERFESDIEFYKDKFNL